VEVSTPRWDDLRKKLTTSKKIKMFLRDELKMHTSEIRREIEKIVVNMMNDRIPKYLDKLEAYIDKLNEKNPTRGKLFKLILEVIYEEEDKFKLPEHLPEGQKFEEEEIEKSVEVQSGIIGRVVISKATPATPYTFSFWLRYDENCHVQPGDMIKIRIPSTGRNKNCIAVVEKVESISDIPDSITGFYSWSYGEPSEEMPTRKPVIRECNARIIYRTDDKHVPFVGPYEVYLAEAKEIEEALSNRIGKQNRILLGFTQDAFETMVPVFGDFRYLFGYRAGHINICGKSGVAGKTSYALFLIANALSFVDPESKEHLLGCIAFNVKEKDLLSIKNFDHNSLDEAIEELRNTYNYELDARMWEKAEELEINPIEIFKKAKFYEPGISPSTDVERYCFGLQDILDVGLDVFMCLFNPEDIDDKMESLFYSLDDEYHDGKKSFNDLINGVKAQLQKAGKTQNVILGNTPHHVATVQKFWNRLNKILRSLQSCIVCDCPRGNPIPVMDLFSGELFVIDIKSLPDNGKRMVFLYIMKFLDQILEAKKEGKNEVRIGSIKISDLSLFPSRVVVFVDELNKFAPSGKSKSPIKSSIIDIVARGRSIGLTLIGAEQLASQIDEEILVNTSTYLVGKQEYVELSDKFYKWIPEGLKERVPYLQPGEMLLFHEQHTVPIIIRFPRPLHRVEE